MACAVAGSSAGLLHLMEVPRHLRRRAHNELRAMEGYVQRHVKVADYMAKWMVGLNCRPSSCRVLLSPWIVPAHDWFPAVQTLIHFSAGGIVQAQSPEDRKKKANEPSPYDIPKSTLPPLTEARTAAPLCQCLSDGTL